MQMSISFRCVDFLAVWKKFWNSNYLFEVELLQHFLQLRKLSRAARKVFAGRMLCRPGLHELDRQLQPSRWGCHSWELQDQPFTFCRRFGTASIFSTVSSACTRSFFKLRATEPEWKLTLNIPRYYDSLQTQGSVCCKWVAIHWRRWRSSST